MPFIMRLFKKGNSAGVWKVWITCITRYTAGYALYMDFRARIESQVLAIGHSQIPTAEKSVLRLLFNHYKNGTGKVTQRDIASAIPDLGAHRRFDDDRAVESTLRQVRQTIRNLRVDHRAPILSDHSGYWIPRSEQEVREYLQHLEHEAKSSAAAHFETYAAMKKSLGIASVFFDEQARLFERPLEFAVKSASVAGRTHTVRALPAGGYSCTCDGFKYRKECGHIEQVKKGDIVTVH